MKGLAPLPPARACPARAAGQGGAAPALLSAGTDNKKRLILRKDLTHNRPPQVIACSAPRHLGVARFMENLQISHATCFIICTITDRQGFHRLLKN